MKKDTLQTPIKIWYESLPRLPKILWPIIDVKFAYKNSSFSQPLHALVDSGANRSILHPFVAEALGFNLKNLGSPKHGGLSASGEYESWFLPELVDVNIYDFSFRCQFTVINNQRLIWPCILGEDSIFEMARLDFQKFKGFFEVSFRADIH